MPGGAWQTFIAALPGALANTLLITLLSSLLGIVEGVVLAFLRLSQISPLSRLAQLIVDFGRGLPTLPFLFLVYFTIETVWFPMPPIEAGSLGLGVLLGFYMAEVFRSGIQAIPVGHVEAALALGMTSATLRRRIILPEGLWPMLPAVGQLIVGNLINSSWVSVIGGADLTGTTRDIIDSYFAVNLWWVLAGVYFILSFPLSRALSYAERRVRTVGYGIST